MKFYKSKYLILLFLPWLFTHCQKPNFPIEISAEDFHQAQDQLTSVMVHDIFSPPVASRVYVYSNIAAYEILAQKEGNQYITLSGILNDFNGISPIKDILINPKLAALIAFIGVGKNLIFSVERISDYLNNLSTQWKKQNLEVYNASNKYAQQVVGEIKLWFDKDNYNQTRTFPKFYVDYDSPSRWQPTPPDYMDGIEPHWSKIRPLVLTSSSQFQPEPPPIFSMEPDSEFYKEFMQAAEVHFLLAEAALAGYSVGGTAQQYYESGITMSMQERTSAGAGAISSYIASSNTPVSFDGGTTPATSDITVAFNSANTEKALEQIITQKWIALFPNGWEAYAEARRTGYPKQLPRVVSDNPDVPVDQIPARMIYTSSEFTTNADAVNAAIASPELGGQDKNNVKLWWDKK